MRADMLVTGARIHTMDDRHPVARSAAIFDGRIVALDEAAEAISTRTRIELGGATIIPGLNDAHMHFSMMGLDFAKLDVSIDAAPTLDALYERIEAQAASLPGGAWVMAVGYDQNKIGAHPRRDVLDRIAGGRPVFVSHTSKHMAVVNSAALARAGHSIDSVPDIDGGHVERDATGVTGLLQENALDLVANVLKPIEQEMLVGGLGAASRWASRFGITSVTEPGIGGMHGAGPAHLRAFQTARDRGLLDTRITVMPFFDALSELGNIGEPFDGFGLPLGIRSGLGDDRLRIGAVKVISDGSLIGRTAAMCCEYEHSPGNAGFLAHDPDYIRRAIVTAHANGWQVATHAIGDRALDIVLDSYQEALMLHPRLNHRHRIEHVGVASDDQIRRIAQLQVIPVPQGRFLSVLGDGFIAALGRDRAELAYRMRSFLDLGVILPGSTDAPVVPGEPMKSIHDMVHRRTANGVVLGAHERLSVREALRAYTVGSAHASFEEHIKGSISPGKLADLVVLSADPFAIDPEGIGEIAVDATMIGGEFVYDNSASGSIS